MNPNSIKTGDPAFPTERTSLGHPSQTIRDHFAGLAMQGMLAAGRAAWGKGAMIELSQSSYQIADAMLAARGES